MCVGVWGVGMLTIFYIPQHPWKGLEPLLPQIENNRPVQVTVYKADHLWKSPEPTLGFDSFSFEHILLIYSKGSEINSGNLLFLSLYITICHANYKKK